MIKEIFTKRLGVLFGIMPMFQLIIGVFWFSSLEPVSDFDHFGFNKTVGAAWDISRFAPVFAFGFSVVAFFGYGILSVAKIRTNFILSLLQFLAFVPLLFWWQMQTGTLVCLLVCLLAINLVLSVANHYKSKSVSFGQSAGITN